MNSVKDLPGNGVSCSVDRGSGAIATTGIHSASLSLDLSRSRLSLLALFLGPFAPEPKKKKGPSHALSLLSFKVVGHLLYSCATLFLLCSAVVWLWSILLFAWPCCIHNEGERERKIGEIGQAKGGKEESGLGWPSGKERRRKGLGRPGPGLVQVHPFFPSFFKLIIFKENMF